MEDTIQIRRLAFGIGAELKGVDLAQPQTATTVEAINRAWWQHQVLLFPEVDITLKQQVAFTRSFGELELHPLVSLRHPSEPEIFEVTNRKIDGKPSESAEVGRVWHSDGAYTIRPPTGSLLYCRAIPSVGGTTWFTSMTKAYDGLSEVMRRTLDSLEVENDLFGNPDMASWRDPAKVAADRELVPPVIQPMVLAHPETGQKALYLSAAVTRGIVGMTREESEPLLRFLFQHCSKPEYVYCHRWRVGDLIMWDNRCAMHLAPADYDPSELRQMFRTTLLGKPQGRYA